MELKITIDPVSYSEFMGLELEYVLENWEEILKKILQDVYSRIGLSNLDDFKKYLILCCICNLFRFFK